ncbi:MAG: hypothetical protein JXR03_18290 [Cyclobacteriaceae bacterium]
MKRAFIFILGIIILFGCSQKLITDWTKLEYTERSFSKIVVVGISKNLEARLKFEKDAVKRLKKSGVNAIPGINIFPENLSGDEDLENIIKILKTENIDGVITMSTVDIAETTRYQPGETQIVPGGYGHFGKYYYQRYAAIHSPGYFIDSKSYLIEAILYDLKGGKYEEKEALVWTGQSSLVDPTSIESASENFTKKLVGHLIGQEIIKVD